MVGIDFPKIEFDMFGLHLLEPMALITDFLLAGLSFFFFYKLKDVNSQLGFYKYWRLFFLVFGIGTFFGGIGHTFYNQLGLTGKILGWSFGPLGIYLSERAMIATHWDNKVKTTLKKLVNIKISLTYIAVVVLIFLVEDNLKSTLPFLPIVITTIIGFIGIVGYLGFKYTEKFSAKFKFFWLGVLMVMPTAFIFILKINVHQWFDKNDFSHFLFMIAITYFYLGVSKLSKGLK